jgi:hypothetical protein
VEKKYKAAEISLNKSIAIYKELNINSHDDLINLQKGIIYKANGNYNSASYCFNTVISKPESNYLRFKSRSIISNWTY